MKRFVIFLLIFVLMMTINPSFNKSSAKINFIHPGLTVNKEQLDYAKQKVLEGKKPWIDGYEMIKKLRAFHPTQSGGDITGESIKDFPQERIPPP